MKQTALVIIVALALVACGSRPTLEPRAGGNPQQVDLSGRWVLRSGGELPVAHEQTIRLPRSSTRRQTETRRAQTERRTKGLSAHLFLESGKVLKVSQTDYGLFFSFDRAVVEEYNFGENRIVSIGPISAQRVSGWDGPAFVVATMDEQGHVLTERWRLEEGTLTREISIAKGDDTSFSKRQVFDPQQR
jgi:hypothetical protein